MKARNYYVYSSDDEYLARLAEEYVYIGRQVKREDGRLIVFALPQRKPKKRDSDDDKTRGRRDSKSDTKTR